MARLIVKWRYIKPGAPKQGEHYVDYIATREGVEIESEKWKDEPATKEQEKLVNRLIADFPDCKDSFEYQDYLSAKTKYTATEFIDKAIEENVDRIGKKENYIGYIAMRPRVEKSGAHGLISYTDEPIKLSKVAKEVGNHDGIVWTTIISLRREDAEKLGYDNLPAWKTLLQAKSQDLANAMGVPITDMKWYAAFHNESGHPHVHLVSYSTGKEPYMTRQGLEKLKAAYAHEIFKNDLYEIYEKQTEYRDELRAESKEKIAEIIRGINGKKYENETLELMLKALAEKLQKHKGKKVYGYLPKDVKNLVNGVIDELMRDSDLQKLYELWYEQRENVLKTYRDKMPARMSLSANEEFKSVRNAVIAEVLNLSFSSTPVIDETPAEPTDKEIEKSEKKSRKDYKTAWQFYDWAKACMDKNGENYNPEFAVKLFTEAANGGITVAKYKLGKMLLNGDGVEKDIVKAVEWLKQAALEENEFAEYALGRLYLKGEEVEKDLPLAMEYLRSAAAKGNEYAAELIRQKELFDKQNISLCISRLFKYLCGVLQEKTEAIRANSTNEQRCTVQINLKKRENGNYEMRVLAGAEGKIAEEIVTYGAESGKEPDGVSADGYLAFCGQNVKADVTSFTIESNGKTTFESAFTHDELAYPDESQNGKIWTISGRYGENAVYCGAANRVGLSAGRGLRSNTAVEANTETEKTFELSFKWYYSAAETPQNSYVGVRFGCGTSENFAGIGKKDGKTVLVWYAKSEIRAFVPLSAEAVAEGENTLLFRGKFGEKLEIEANGVTHELDNFDTTGNFALSLYRTGETGNEAAGDTAKIEIDDALFVRYVSRNSKAESVSNDFSGVKISEIEASDGILSVKEYYINRSAYYVGAEVNLPLVYAEGKKGSLLFGECKNYGYFAPKKEYSEWIMRFDLRVTDERNVKQNPDGSFDLPKLKSGAMLGVSFGKEYAAQSATETDGIFFYNWYNPDFTEGKQTYTGADGQVYCGTYLAASDTEKSSWKFGNAPISYDLWGDKSAVYNIMVIAENSTAKLYMKRADESAEKMSSPIFTVTGVNTCGYAAIVGLNSASFRISNYSVTNISPYRGRSGK